MSQFQVCHRNNLSLTYSAYCKATVHEIPAALNGHEGQSTRSSPSRGRNIAECKLPIWAKGHFVVGHPFGAAVVVVLDVVPEGVAIHCPSHFLRTSSGDHNG